MSLIVHLPLSGAAQQLFLLFHGVGAAPDDLVPLGQVLAKQFPRSAIVSVQAPHDCPYSSGFQWFSVDGITQAQRGPRTREAMPAFIEAVAHWQQTFQLGAEATALVGFSQGAIMALSSTQYAATQEPLAARIVALSGRFAELPTLAPERCTIHMIHGKSDTVISYAHTIAGAERLVELGADVTADVIPFVGHEITDEITQLILERLTTHIPQRLWQEAQQAAHAPSPPSS